MHSLFRRRLRLWCCFCSIHYAFRQDGSLNGKPHLGLSSMKPVLKSNKLANVCYDI